MRKISLAVYTKLLEESLIYEQDMDVLFRKLLCTIIHLCSAADKLEMSPVHYLLEELYQTAARYHDSSSHENTPLKTGGD